MSDLDINRLLLQFEAAVKEINRNHINPEISELQLTDLNPVINLVAQARARYLKDLFDLAKVSENSPPSAEQIKELKTMRETYEELVAGSKALEVAIERGYLDIQT